MTTTVIIKSQNPNHENVEIIARNPATGKQHTSCYAVLGDGNTHTAYVHDGSELLIREIKKSDSAPTSPGVVQTFGVKAVGLAFNPGGSIPVTNCKEGFAALIDQMNLLRENSTDAEVKRLASIAITEAQTAQMWAVKALTWSA